MKDGIAWRRSVRAAWCALVLACGVSGWTISAQAQTTPDPQDVAEGMTLYRTKADCQTCHGWAADGRKMDTQMPDAPSLRTSRLGRAGIVYAIRCGRPGRGMPAFDRQAYKDPARCNNTTLADLQKNGQTLTDPAATLQPREIEMITDFLFEKVIGKGPMDHAKCVEYWGEDLDVCREVAK
ncbi:MAG: cytochrome c [Vicinamibacterales bacterium]